MRQILPPFLALSVSKNLTTDTCLSPQKQSYEEVWHPILADESTGSDFCALQDLAASATVALCTSSPTYVIEFIRPVYHA
jgi:hypothetical protein